MVYVRLQRTNKLTSEDKLALLEDRLDQVSDKWDDLGFGCQQLFGDSRNPESFKPEIYEISQENNKFFFLVTHCPGPSPGPTLDEYTKIWPRAKIVYLRNSNGFVNWRLGLPKDLDRTTYQLPQDFKDVYDRQLVARNDIYVWDTDWYFDQDTCVKAVKNLYDDLGLDDFNETYLRTFYTQYMEKLNQIREKYLDNPYQDRCW